MTLRLTWVQPEDLVGHELRLAAEDGRDAHALAARWEQAGGPPAPETAGASESPARPSAPWRRNSWTPWRPSPAPGGA